MNETIVITGADNIRKVQMLTIQSGLTLQVNTGLKHSRNGCVNGAKAILQNAGIKPKRNIKALLNQFYEYRKTIDPLAKPPEIREGK